MKNEFIPYGLPSIVDPTARCEEEVYDGDHYSRFARLNVFNTPGHSCHNKIFRIKEIIEQSSAYGNVYVLDDFLGSDDPGWNEEYISEEFDTIIDAINGCKYDSVNLSWLMDFYVIVLRFNQGIKVFDTKEAMLKWDKQHPFAGYRCFGAVFMEHLCDANNPMPQIQCVCSVNGRGELSLLKEFDYDYQSADDK